MTAAALPVQVAPGAHRISVPLPFPPREVAAWVIEGDNGHVLVDTGIDTPPARDGDVGAVFGIGFPPFRGGPFWYVDRAGAQHVLDRLRALEQRYGARFRPAKMLEEMARDGTLFFPDA